MFTDKEWAIICICGMIIWFCFGYIVGQADKKRGVRNRKRKK